MGNCLQILYHRTFNDDRTRLATTTSEEEEIMGASQSSSSSSSSLSSSSQQENNYDRYAAMRAAESSNIINQHLSRNMIRVHQRSERPRATVCLIDILILSWMLLF